MPLDGGKTEFDDLGFPVNFELFMLEGDERQGGIGLNTKARRPAIGDQQAAWLENLIPLGLANLRAIWGNATPVYSLGTIINLCFYNRGSTAYAIAFNQDGSAVEVNLVSGATTSVGPAGTFFAIGNSTTPTIAQWSNAGILIVSNIGANAYWAWDGSLHSPGDATSPTWLNGGTPTAMPNGVAGSDIEVFLSRVWITSGTNILTSAASNGATFSAAAGGLTKPSTDQYLRVGYTAIRQSNGYLYVFGDSEIAYITNVQTSAQSVTTYQFTIIDQEIGTPWRDSVVAFGRSLIFGNINGIHAVYGSTANKISDDLDGIWNLQSADFQTIIPSAAVVTIFGIKCLAITVRTTDPTTSTMRNIMVLFDGKKWFVASQSIEPLIIATQELNSNLQCWGTDGASIFQCFARADATLLKKLQSKLWGGKYGITCLKQALRFYTQIDQINNAPIAFTFSFDNEVGSTSQNIILTGLLQFVNNSGGVLQFQNNGGGNLNFQTNASIAKNTVDGSGNVIGYTITSTTADFVIERTGLGYQNLTANY